MGLLFLRTGFVVVLIHASNCSINLSINREAHMSSYETEYNPDIAVDGNIDQMKEHCIETMGREIQAWWQVTLDERSVINNIEMYSRDLAAMRRLAGFSVYVSNTSDVLSGERCYHHDGRENPELHQVIPCVSIGRYVTISLQRPPESGFPSICHSSSAELQLCEVEVMGCPIGFFGPQCEQSCSRKCINGLCDPESGHCMYGCRGNAFGPSCEQECTEPGCSRHCEGHCANGICDNQGVCLNGCEAGWSGTFCETECGPEHFGKNCDQRCYCDHGSCDNINGTCPDQACLEGWQPPSCSKVALQVVMREPHNMVASSTFNSVVAVSLMVNAILIGILTTICLKMRLFRKIPKTVKKVSFKKKATKEKLQDKKITEEPLEYYDSLENATGDRKANDYSQPPNKSEYYLEPSGKATNTNDYYLEPSKDDKDVNISNDYQYADDQDIYYSIN